MVTFDTKTKILTFKKQYNLNGEVAWSAGIDVDLNRFDEQTRQFMIGLAKQAINFANGHKTVEQILFAAKKAEVKESNSDTKPSPEEKKPE